MADAQILDLLPCPFCGSARVCRDDEDFSIQDAIEDGSVIRFIRCEGCGARTAGIWDNGRVEDDAPVSRWDGEVAVWNRREGGAALSILIRLSPLDFARLVAWFQTPPDDRQPSHLAFTSGVARDAASAWEAAQRKDVES